MTSRVKRASLLIIMACSLHLAAGNVQASHITYTYMKIGEGQGASVRAFTSRQACEAAKRRYESEWARAITRVKAKIGNYGTFAAAPRTRCLDTLPYGFRRPKTGH
jgi:hypothetical protein